MSEPEMLELGMTMVLSQGPRLPHWIERPRKHFRASLYEKEDLLPAWDTWENDSGTVLYRLKREEEVE